MKRKIYILSLIILILFSAKSYASTNTEPRTESDLKVSNDIIVTNSNKNNILNTPKVNEEEKIYDFADLFTDEEETELYNSVMKYIDKNNIDMVIVTTNENKKYSSREYADDFFDYNYFGIGDTHDGILFLIDMKYREVYISTTGNAISIYKDSYINSMLDKIYNKSPLDNPYGCAKEFVKTATHYYKKYKNGGRNLALLCSFAVSAIITFIVIKVQCSKHKPVKVKLNGEDYLNKNSINITVHDDILVNTYVSKTRIDHSSSGGGSSSHSGSSGISHRRRR